MATKRKHKHKRRHKTKAIVHRRRSYGRPARRRTRKGGGGHSLFHTLLAAAAVGYVVENVPAISTVAAKIPGAKTFGTAAAIGAAALAVDHFVYRNKWIRLVGVGGAAVAAYQLGSKKFAVTWVGDEAGLLGDADDGMIADVDD